MSLITIIEFWTSWNAKSLEIIDAEKNLNDVSMSGVGLN